MFVKDSHIEIHSVKQLIPFMKYFSKAVFISALSEMPQAAELARLLHSIFFPSQRRIRKSILIC